ncbi:MAG: hypothetical protein ACE5EE_09435 [Fidelibacterota bacterium]
MKSLDEKLKFLAMKEIVIPDVDVFLNRLHGSIHKREERRQSLVSGIMATIIFLIVGFGVYQNSYRLKEIPVYINGESFLISEIDELEQYDIVFDEALIYASAEYLLEDADVLGDDWELLKELDEAEIIDLEDVLSLEEQS